MKILTLGDSWTYGSESSDPATKSWPAQMANKYGVEVVNLGRGGSSNQRAVRIGTEELSRNNSYDWVVLGLAPANRTEILKQGKWHQIWPGREFDSQPLDKIYLEFWHPWNDLQNTMYLCLQFLAVCKFFGPKLLITGLSMLTSDYKTQLDWILNYRNDYDFERLKMPLKQFNISIKDLDRKLQCLKAMHETICSQQPEYLYDVVKLYLETSAVKHKYGSDLWAKGGHPNDQGYHALCDYFATKLNLDGR
jgi:hypothetical protein